jgi:hypothetical protein
MFRAVWQALYGKEEARFTTSLPVDVAVQRLAAVVKPPRWKCGLVPQPVFGWFDPDSLAGEVSRDRIIVWHDIPLMRRRSIFAFVGHWESSNTQSVLIGQYQLHPVEQRVWTYSFSFLGAFSLIIAPLLFVAAEPGWHRMYLLLPPFMMLIGAFVVLASGSLSGDDRAYIANAIRAALDSTD